MFVTKTILKCTFFDKPLGGMVPLFNKILDFSIFNDNDNNILFDHNVQIETTIFNSIENQIVLATTIKTN